jgi:imidazolonepropionase-like amidohydrolase
MRLYILWLIGCAVAGQMWVGPIHAASASHEALIITGVTVIDTVRGVRHPDMDVVILGQRIQAVGRTTEVDRPAPAMTIDGSGAYLIPGLWDMHVHVCAYRHTAPMFIANGVTGVREMASDCWDPCTGQMVRIEEMRDFQQQIASGGVLGPRLLTLASAKVLNPQAPRSHGIPEFYRPHSAEEGRQLVRSLHSRGADFIKTDDSLSHEVFFAMADEAKRRGFYLAGHVPDAISVSEAAEAGLRSIEHARVIPFDCAPGRRRDRQHAVQAYSAAMCTDLFARLVANHTYYVPTHLTRKMDAFAHDPSYRNDTRLNYIHACVKGRWMLDADSYARARKARQTYLEFYHHGLKLTGDAHRAGVKILAGTDANDTYVFPGFSLHDELAELVQAGLTPLAALQAATIHAAGFFERTDEFGSVEAGKMADAVLLEADPLADIRNTTRIKAVIYNGKLLTRAQLDAILAEAQVTARRSWESHGHAPVQVALWDAVIVGDIAGMRAALKAGADVDGLDTRREMAGLNGRRPLNYAAWRNDTTMLEALLEAGAEIDAANRSGFMPLHHAAETGSTDAAALLISYGASLTRQNHQRETPLETAKSHRHVETAAVIRQAMPRAR